MRTGKMLVVAVLFCVVPLAVVQAQRTPGSISLAAYGGVGLLMGPDSFKDYWKMGIGLGAEIRYNFTEYSCVGISFTYQPFGLKEGSAELGGTLKMHILSGNFVQYFTSPDNPICLYATLGGGYYMMKPEEGNASEDESGLNGGAALEMMVSRDLFLFAEGKFHYVFTEGDHTSFITIMGGIRWAP